MLYILSNRWRVTCKKSNQEPSKNNVANAALCVPRHLYHLYTQFGSLGYISSPQLFPCLVLWTACLGRLNFSIHVFNFFKERNQTNCYSHLSKFLYLLQQRVALFSWVKDQPSFLAGCTVVVTLLVFHLSSHKPYFSISVAGCGCYEFSVSRPLFSNSGLLRREKMWV